MHDRDMTWVTSEGVYLALKDIQTNHLCNIIKHIEKKNDIYNERFGEKRMIYVKENFKQEMRLRKLNRLTIVEQEQNLF